MGKMPWQITIGVLAGGSLLVYYLYKRNKFPFEKGGILDEIKSDVSDIANEGQLPLRSDGSGKLDPVTGQPLPSQPVTGPNSVIPAQPVPGLPGNPSATDYNMYENYVNALKQQFPGQQNLGPSGPVIGGDATTFGAVGPGGINPPIQPYPGQRLMPPPTQQQYPYYRPMSMPISGGGMPIMPPGYRPPMGPPPRWYDDVWGVEWEPVPHPAPTPTPTPTPQTGCKIKVGDICIGYDGSVKIGNKIHVGGGGIKVGGLTQLSGGNSLSNRNNNVSINGKSLGSNVNAGAINSQVQNMLNDIFAKTGINR